MTIRPRAGKQEAGMEPACRLRCSELIARMLRDMCP